MQIICLYESPSQDTFPLFTKINPTGPELSWVVTAEGDQSAEIHLPNEAGKHTIHLPTSFAIADLKLFKIKPLSQIPQST